MVKVINVLKQLNITVCGFFSLNLTGNLQKWLIRKFLSRWLWILEDTRASSWTRTPFYCIQTTKVFQRSPTLTVLNTYNKEWKRTSFVNQKKSLYASFFMINFIPYLEFEIELETSLLQATSRSAVAAASYLWSNAKLIPEDSSEGRESVLQHTPKFVLWV